MNRLKVLFPIPRFEGGGLERVQLYIARGLIEEGCEIEILSHTIYNDPKKLIPSNIKIKKISKNKYTYFVKLLIYLVNKKSFVITSSNDIGCFLLFFKCFFLKHNCIIWTQHLSIIGPLQLAKSLRKIKLLIEFFLIKKLIKKSDAVVAVSESVASEIQYYINSSLKIDIIYNPVMSKKYELDVVEHINWPWVDDHVATLIFVGRIEPVKRLDLLIEAFMLCRSNIPVRLLIIGEGSEQEKYKKIVKKLSIENDCKFMGFQSNPLPWIKKANLLVLSSDVEGFGLVLVEAMACGTQIVSTDCPSGPAELLENGKYGRLVPTNNSQKLADAIYKSLKFPIISSEELRERAKKFQIEFSVQQYIELIKNLKITGKD